MMVPKRMLKNNPLPWKTRIAWFWLKQIALQAMEVVPINPQTIWRLQ